MTAPPPLSDDSAKPSLRVPHWLFVTAASIWGITVLGGYFRAFPVPWSAALADGVQALTAARHLSLGLVAEHTAVLLSVLLLVVAAMAVGRGFLALLRVNGLSPAERLLFSATLGFGALSYVMLGLTAVGGLSSVGAWVLVAFLAVAEAFLRLKRRATERDRPVTSKRARLPLLEKVAVVALLLHGGLTLIGALAPLVFYDSLAYHFSAPQLSMLNGQLMPMPENLLTQMPASAGYLYALAVLLKNEIAAKVLCWLFGVTVACAIGVFARRLSWTGVGLWAALIFVTVFQVSQSSTAGGVDLALALYGVCAVHSFLAWMEANHQSGPRSEAFPLLVLSAVFSGLAISTKYTGAFVPAGLIGTLFFSRWRSGTEVRSDLRASLWLALIAGLVFSPWLIKNAVLFGNPVAPFFPGVFAEADAAQLESIRAFTAEAAQHRPRSLQTWVTLPWNLTMGAVPNSHLFSPLFLLFCPLLLLFKSFPRSLRWAALFTVLFAAIWAMTSTVVRYLMPALPWACLLLAYWTTHARLKEPLRVVVKTTILGCCVAGIVMSWAFAFQQGGWRVVLGAESKHNYLSHSHNGYVNPSYEAYQWINAELPATARVLLLGESRGYHLNRDYIASSAFNKSPLLSWAEQSAHGEELAETLLKQGVTHVLLNPAEATRLQPYGTLKTTRGGKRTLQDFWSKHVSQLARFDELAKGKVVNRVTLHAISPRADEGPGLPGYMARLLETP